MRFPHHLVFSQLWAAFVWSLPLSFACVSAAEELPANIDAFVSANCLDCHQGSDSDAGLDFDTLGSDLLADEKLLQRWVRIFDRVHDGEMPPENAETIDAGDLKTFLASTHAWIRQSQLQEYQRLGRVRARRLTNRQLERTLHDLLGIDRPLAGLMTEDQRTDGFTNVAAGQSMSHFQLESHLNVVDAALDAALERAADDDSNWIKTFSARELARRNPRQRCRDPEMIDDQAVVWSSGLTFYGRITSTTVRNSGWYRIAFSASAINKPSDHGVWCTVRSGACTSGAPLMSWIGSFEATDDVKTSSFLAWIPAGHMIEIRPGDETLKQARFSGGQVGAGEGGPQNVPGVALHSMIIEQIHPAGSVATTRGLLFGGLPVKVDGKSHRLRLQSDDPGGDLAKQLRAFARRAFRRPTSDEILKPYLNMLETAIDSGDDPLDALRASYRAILCSPRFLYFTERPGPLDDHAIAARLSYFLWDSMPDAALMRLADQGRLRDSRVLTEQVGRMLGGHRTRQFVEDFAGQWLDLVDIDFTEPDRKLYRDFDIVVQNAMLAETHLFLEQLLVDDASVANLVDTDFTFVNSRLARFYGIDGVEGDQMRRVELEPEHHRGGLLAHGSILKVTANGTNTSPVLRGIWVSERILGVQIPPPPENVPAIEPDIRGAKTIREQLQKHVADAACASCHRKIDPPGYALENFDAAGRWRDHYVNVDRGRFRRGAVIDASFEMADGRVFENFGEFRKLLLSDVRPIARNVAEKLLVYGTGAPISFADRDEIDRSVDQSKETDYGLRSLLNAVVTSPTFLSK